MTGGNAFALQAFEQAIDRREVDPGRGLPDAIFDFALKITPMINVDLLVRDNRLGLLWAWRSDAFGTGWHIPGGIIRMRERFGTRISEVARTELGATVEADSEPCHVLQLLDGGRGHFISLLFRCRLVGELRPPHGLVGDDVVPEPGQLCWFQGMPRSVYPAHEAYRELIESSRLLTQ